MAKMPTSTSRKQLPKASTGIPGLDEITGGRFPNAKPGLIYCTAGFPLLVRN